MAGILSGMLRRAGLSIVALMLAAGCASSRPPAPSASGWLKSNALALRLMHGNAVALELVLDDAAKAHAQAPALTASVSAVEARLPSPDAALSSLVHAAAEDYGQGAVEALNVGGIGLARAYLARGDKSFREAVKRSGSLGRSVYA